MEILTGGQEKTLAYLVFLTQRAALYMDYEDEKADYYYAAVRETADLLRKQNLNPLKLVLGKLEDKSS